MAKNPKIVFLGTSVFGQIVLKNLLEEGIKINAVVTQPDRPLDHKTTPSPVRTVAKANKIPVLTPDPKLGLAKLYPKLRKINPDLFLVASYGMTIPNEALLIPKKGALKVHPSILPRHRGPAPIPAAILAGDEQTGATVIQMDEQTDHGPILAQKEIPLTSEDTAISLTAKLAPLSGQLLAKSAFSFLIGKTKPRPQEHGKSTYSQLIRKEDGKINWGSSNEMISRMLRAYQPWPGAWTPMGELAEELDRELKNPKSAEKEVQLLKAHLDGGALVVDLLQSDGKAPLTLTEFIAAYFI